MIMAISHTNCAHPATKAARAKCRKEAAKAPEVAPQAPAELTLDQVVKGYYDNSLEAEEFAAHLLGLQRKHPALKPLVDGYYDNSLDLEEIAAQADALRPMTPSASIPPMPSISPRYRQSTGRMRGTATRKSDTSYSFTRRIAGKEYDFTIVRWAGGTEGSTIWVEEGGTTNTLKEFHRNRAETFAHHNRRR